MSHPVLTVAPSSGRAEDATGALPLHWATRNPDVSFEVIDLLLKAHPEAPGKTDSKVGLLSFHTPILRVLYHSWVEHFISSQLYV